LHALGIDREAVRSWDLDVLGMTKPQMCAVVRYVVFSPDFDTGTSDRRKFDAFLRKVDSGYHDNPFHNFAHAVDVLAAFGRMVKETPREAWASDTDLYALMIACLGINIGHTGRTNGFLVETGHGLALTYNDASPLENMHAASLFDIVKAEGCNIFGKLSKDAFKKSRKVAISAILHTDTVHHFEMVKQLEMLKELRGEQFNEDNPSLDEIDQQLLRNAFVHLADQSFSFASTEVCQAWGQRQLEELFKQGDAEKHMGIPIGMLNDRERVTCSAMLGFTEFLVAPLVIVTCQVFPRLMLVAKQLATNFDSWKDLWELDTDPCQEEISKYDQRAQKFRDRVKTILD